MVGKANLPLQDNGSLLIAIAMLSLAIESLSSPDQGRLIATADIVSRKYCSAVAAELFTVVFTFRVKFENRTDKVLILDKRIGKFPDEQIVAKNRESLALRDFESEPIFDTFGLDDEPSYPKPSRRLLKSNFVLLAPGQSFESRAKADVFVWYRGTPDRKGPINYGDHVLQMGFSAWSHPRIPPNLQRHGRLLVNLLREKFTRNR
jgi:hypothetical protein